MGIGMSKIMNARKEWLPRLTQLWEDAFQDSEEEIRRFQRRLFRPQDTWCCLIQQSEAAGEGKHVPFLPGADIASVIYEIPARLWTREGCQPASYLYAGTTGKEYRRQGFYGKMLRMLSKSACCQGYPILTPAKGLIPLYEHCGYHVLGRKADAEIKERNAFCGLQIKIRKNAMTGAEYKAVRDEVFLNRLSLSELDGYVEWCEQYLAYAIEEVLSAGGVAAGISVNGQEHVLLAHRREHTLLIVDTTLSDAFLSVCAWAMENTWGVDRIVRRGFVLMGSDRIRAAGTQGDILQNVHSLHFGVTMDE